MNNIGTEINLLKIENTDTSKLHSLFESVFTEMHVSDIKRYKLLPHQFKITSQTITIIPGNPVIAGPFYIHKKQIEQALKKNGFNQKLVIR